jgi:hypothetical protein
MPERKIPIEVISPTQGVHLELPASIIEPRSLPNARNANTYFGVLQKEYGTSLLTTSAKGVVTLPPSLIFEAPFPANTTLQVFNNTAMYQYAANTCTNDGQVYTGAFTDIWQACMHFGSAAGVELWFTNGKDPIQYKAAYNSTGTTEAGALAAGTYKAYAIQSFKEHLNIYRTIEAGVECPQRIRWTKVGLLGHNASDWSTGGSGFLDLADAEGDILSAAPLGPGLMSIYTEGSIHSQRWVGGTDIYRFDKVISGVTVPTRRCVAVNEATHYVLLRDGVYEYIGSSPMKKISSAVDQWFKTLVNPNTFNTSFLQYVKEDDELRVYVPEGSATLPNKCYVCKLADSYAWFKLDRNYTCCGKSSRPSALTIGDLVGNIGAQDWKFGDTIATAGVNIHVLGDYTGHLVKMDKTLYSISEAGTSIPQTFVIDSKDFTSIKDVDPLTKDRYDLSEYMDNQSRWVGVTYELKGQGSVLPQYSVDAGNSWDNFPEGPKDLSTQWTMVNWDVDVANKSFMLRLTNTGTNESVHVGYWKVEFVPGSAA